MRKRRPSPVSLTGEDYRWLRVYVRRGQLRALSRGILRRRPWYRLELPIFDQKQAVIARLEAQLRAALGRETALAVDVRSEVRVAQARVAAMRTLVERYAKVVVPLRERAVALSQEAVQRHACSVATSSCRRSRTR